MLDDKVCPYCNTVNSLMAVGVPIFQDNRVYVHKRGMLHCMKCDKYVHRSEVQGLEDYSHIAVSG